MKHLKSALKRGDIDAVLNALEEGREKDFNSLIFFALDPGLLTWPWLFTRESVAPILKELISKGGNVNSRDRWGCTPLFYAIRNGDVKSVMQLTEDGAHVNCKDEGQSATLADSPLDLALELQTLKGGDVWLEIVTILKRAGAKEGNPQV